jgi:hypothetical protein
MYFAYKVIGIDSYSMHARVANPQRGESTFFFPLSDSVARLGYEGANIQNIVPRKEVDETLKAHADYFSFALKLGIENNSEGCPIPAGMKWFDL